MAAPLELYVANDTDLVIEGLRLASADPGVYITDAVITTTITDKFGTAISGSPVSMPYEAASNGNYRGTLLASGGVVAGITYFIVFAASNYGLTVNKTTIGVIRGEC